MLYRKEACVTISRELLDELLKGVERPGDLLGDAGLMKEGLLQNSAYQRIHVANLVA